MNSFRAADIIFICYFSIYSNFIRLRASDIKFSSFLNSQSKASRLGINTTSYPGLHCDGSILLAAARSLLRILFRITAEPTFLLMANPSLTLLLSFSFCGLASRNRACITKHAQDHLVPFEVAKKSWRFNNFSIFKNYLKVIFMLKAFYVPVNDG